MTEAIDINGANLLINFELLRNSDRLVGATIFKRLFNLVPAGPPFIDTSMKVNDDGKLTILKDYGISANEWRHFMYFIQLGITEHFVIANSNLPESNAYRKLFLQNLDKFYLHGVPSKFGPFPAIDEYYNNIMGIEKKRVNQNPQTPEEDDGDLFYWSNSGFQLNSQITSGERWSITNTRLNNSTSQHFWKKRKNIEEIKDE